jgi:PleD family two-component response regulator
VLTGSADPDLAWRSIRAGAQDCLAKSSINGEMLVARAAVCRRAKATRTSTGLSG